MPRGNIRIRNDSELPFNLSVSEASTAEDYPSSLYVYTVRDADDNTHYEVIGFGTVEADGYAEFVLKHSLYRQFEAAYSYLRGLHNPEGEDGADDLIEAPDARFHELLAQSLAQYGVVYDYAVTHNLRTLSPQQTVAQEIMRESHQPASNQETAQPQQEVNFKITRLHPWLDSDTGLFWTWVADLHNKKELVAFTTRDHSFIGFGVWKFEDDARTDTTDIHIFIVPGLEQMPEAGQLVSAYSHLSYSGFSSTVTAGSGLFWPEFAEQMRNYHVDFSFATGKFVPMENMNDVRYESGPHFGLGQVYAYLDEHSPLSMRQIYRLDTSGLYRFVEHPEGANEVQLRNMLRILQIPDSYTPTPAELDNFYNRQPWDEMPENVRREINHVAGDDFRTNTAEERNAEWSVLVRHYPFITAEIEMAPSGASAGQVPTNGELARWRGNHALSEAQRELLREQNLPEDENYVASEERALVWKIYNNQPIPSHRPDSKELRDWLEYHQLSDEQVSALRQLARATLHPRLEERDSGELIRTWQIYLGRIPEELRQAPSRRAPTEKQLRLFLLAHGAEIPSQTINNIIQRGLSMPVESMTSKQRKRLYLLLDHALYTPDEARNNGRARNPTAEDIRDWLSRHLLTHEMNELLSDNDLDLFEAENLEQLTDFEKKQVWAILHNRPLPEHRLTRGQQAELERELNEIPYSNAETVLEEEHRNQFLAS